MEEKQPFKDLIESMEVLDNFNSFVVKPSDIPKPKDDFELEVQNLVIQSGLPYDQKAVESLAETVRSAKKNLSFKVNKTLWSYIVILLFELFQKEKSKMTAMKIAFLYGISFHASSQWKELTEDEP